MNDFNITKINKRSNYTIEVYYQKEHSSEMHLAFFLLELLIQKKYKNSYIPLEEQTKYSILYDFILINHSEFLL